MYFARQLKWNEVHNKWNDIKFPEPYQQYLQQTYNITVTNGRVIWGHVIEVILVPESVGGPSDFGGAPGKKKKPCKEIKLIFIMDDLRKDQKKLKCKDKVSVKLVSDIQNHLEQQFETKIILSDVQIIKG
tara:strand:+ start:377 stop:766 length:390 start_codon:yes stop_codon:yes gene_type:complete